MALLIVIILCLTLGPIIVAFQKLESGHWLLIALLFLLWYFTKRLFRKRLCPLIRRHTESPREAEPLLGSSQSQAVYCG